MLTARPATAEDVKVFYPEITASFRAWVAELDGELSGIVGIALLRPTACMFSAFKDELRPYLGRPVIMRQVKKAQAAVRMSRVPVWAVADPEEPTSPGILGRLGFKPLGEVEGDQIFAWTPGEGE